MYNKILFVLLGIFLLCIVYDTETGVVFTHGPLGKLIILILIIYVSSINLYIGAVTVFLAILYYKFTEDYLRKIKTNFLEGVDVVYWINLDRSDKRRKRMENMFQNPLFANIPIERVHATDGKSDTPFMKRLQFSKKRNTPLEYACLISHMDALKQFANSPYETALIMEDDATLELRPFWKKTVKEIVDAAPSDWEIIQLCYNTTSSLYKEYTLNTNYHEPSVYGNCACLTAYLIRKQTAEKFLNDTYDKTHDVYHLKDYHTHEADHYFFKCMKTYIYKYMMFVYPTDNDSTLHPEDLPSHIRSKNRVLQMYRSM